MKTWLVRGSVLSLAGVLLSPLAHAEFFGRGENRFEIPFVEIGSPGNAADTTGDPNPAGRVDYSYQIGKFEVPQEAIRKANAQSALDGEPLNLPMRVDLGPQKPMVGLSWFQIARFVNWLNAEAGSPPAYKFNEAGDFLNWEPGDPGYNPANPYRNARTLYALPTADEWYKAAYYDPAIDAYWDYPTGSDTPPVPVASGVDPGTAVWDQPTGPADVTLAGGPSPFGTVGQGGNVFEWNETAVGLLNDDAGARRIVRGGSSSVSITPENMASFIRVAGTAAAFPVNAGFRVVRVPEPSTGVLSASVLCCLWRRVRRRHGAARS
ncbi:SUMF1/EgtB/PvdO family nonheme iron enzyme [Botrimarina sp.]|uniref:formylglycine-generating enzyme family protein n=1 Tax=Botrimarina sp. TaxID=2795802 RepID=UPI0032EE9DB9